MYSYSPPLPHYTPHSASSVPPASAEIKQIEQELMEFGRLKQTLAEKKTELVQLQKGQQEQRPEIEAEANLEHKIATLQETITSLMQQKDQQLPRIKQLHSKLQQWKHAIR